jgi:exodeoxyribonuclease VII small subunit
MAKRNDTPPKSFEDALAELERIIADVETGEIGLEESLLKHERGNFLIQYCRGVLDSAEKQIEMLSKGPDGSLQSAALPASTAEPVPADSPQSPK